MYSCPYAHTNIISIRLYRGQYLHGMRYPYLLLLLNFVLLSLMSGCIFKLAQVLLFYVPVHILLDSSNYWTNTPSCKNCGRSLMLKITQKFYVKHTTCGSVDPNLVSWKCLVSSLHKFLLVGSKFLLVGITYNCLFSLF